MNTSDNKTPEQTIIERVTVTTNKKSDINRIEDKQMNVWKDVKTGEVADLDYFLKQGWRIVNMSSSTSMAWSPGATLYNLTHSQLLLEKN